jgi:glycosyltransferase involved in cell wall biosynthesis
MKLSVIVPCRNAAHTISVQLDALAGQRADCPWEVVVADNGSTDRTRAIVERYTDVLPGLRIVDASARPGQPHALNAGARAATGDAFLFCDADDEVGSGWLAAMGSALREHEFVACRIDPRKLNEPWVCAGHGYSQWHGLQRISLFPWIAHAGGGTLGIRRSVFEAVGGFDEELPVLHDTYLCLRVQFAGTALHFVPEAVVHVRYRHTFRGIYLQARAYAEYGVLLYKKSLALGVPPIDRPLRSGARAWRDLLLELPRARSKADRVRWVYGLGWRVGRLRGSIRYGAFVL